MESEAANLSDYLPIIIAGVIAILVVVLLVLRQRKPADRDAAADRLAEREREGIEGPPVPATKEVFAAAPVAKPKEPVVPPAPERAAAPAEAKKAQEPAPASEPAKAPKAPAQPAPERVAPTAEAKAAEKPEARAAEKPEARAEVKPEAKAAEKPAAQPPAAPAPEPVKPKHTVTLPGEAPEAKTEEPPPRTLKDGLGRTRKEGFIAKLGGLFKGKTIDQDLIDQIEEVLFTADIGVRTADRLLQTVRDALSKKELKDADRVWALLRAEATAILAEAHDNVQGSKPKPGEPHVTMVLGVNGTGKTTSIGKLAHQLVAAGKSVALIAGDTFRAAAAEQLEHWGRRVGAETSRGAEGADPASVVFDGVRAAVEAGVDYVLVDTAGRLHTQVNLMEELKKVRRVMGKAIDGAPHEVLMVLDATTGQNAINQAKMFKDATDVTGIILTKLDGTAKGGVVLGVCDELRIPIRYVGIGERVADLRDFDAREFVDELFAPPA